MSYLKNLIAALHRDGTDVDETENAALGGSPKQTISLRVAMASKDKKFWGSLACVFLSLAVQWHHCRKTRENAPIPWYDYPRIVLWLTWPVWFIAWGCAYGFWPAVALTVLAFLLCAAMSIAEAKGLL